MQRVASVPNAPSRAGLLTQKREAFSSNPKGPCIFTTPVTLGGGGGGGDSFANITLAISSRCFSILLLSLGAFHKVLDLRVSLLQKVFVLLRVYLLENLNLILIFYKSFC